MRPPRRHLLALALTTLAGVSPACGNLAGGLASEPAGTPDGDGPGDSGALAAPSDGNLADGADLADGTDLTGGPDPRDASDAPSPVVARCEPCVAARDGIVDGLRGVHFPLSMSRVEADPSRWFPLVWASAGARGGDVAGLPGTLPAPGWVGLHGAGRVAVWAGHEGTFTGDADGQHDNDAFRIRLLKWLLGGGARVGVASGHGPWLTLGNLSPAVRRGLEADGATFSELPDLDAASLGGVDLLILGNPWGQPWGTFPDAALDAIVGWVERGGAVLALGLGWSWRGTMKDPMAANYPLERLGARLGFSVRDGAIHDPTPPLGAPETPGYAFAPSSAWNPQRVIVISREDPRLARLAALSRDNPSWILVIEGEHMGFSLPSADWEALADPRGALDALDRVYRAEVELVGGRGPYGGAKIWLTPLDAPNAPWWMHSGNPIVFQAAAARAEILPRLAAEGHPGWGVAHELGHNLHGSSCGDLFVPTHTTEVWPNVFALWSYHRNGWSPTAQMGPDLFAQGHAHHAAATPSFEAIKADPFVLLGALELIWRRYGWEGFGRFFTAAAIAVEGGAAAGDDAARLAWWVEHLSEAYAVDFAPVIAHWGFPVTPATAAATSRFPPADLD